MPGYDWDWSIVWHYRAVFGRGVLITLGLTLSSILLGTVIGFVVGPLLTLRGKKLAEVRCLLSLLVDLVRSLPILILILLLYYWLPFVVGIKSPLWIALLALAINLGAFIADVLRGAIEGVPRPLVEAAMAVGMRERTIMRRVLIPEATKNIVPTMALLYIDILKLSSLASVIAVGELVHVASEISTKTYRYLEVYAALAAIYIAIVLPFSLLARRLERSSWFLRRG